MARYGCQLRPGLSELNFLLSITWPACRLFGRSASGGCRCFTLTRAPRALSPGPSFPNHKTAMQPRAYTVPMIAATTNPSATTASNEEQLPNAGTARREPKTGNSKWLAMMKSQRIAFSPWRKGRHVFGGGDAPPADQRPSAPQLSRCFVQRAHFAENQTPLPPY